MKLRFRMFYHAQDKDDLFLDCLAPLVSSLNGATDDEARVAVERHWKGGPHVRLYVDVPERHAAASRELVTTEVDDYLARHPSQHEMSAEEVAKLTTKFGRLEGVSLDQLDGTPHANNTLVVDESWDDPHGFPNAETLSVVQDYAADTFPLVMDLLSASRGDRARRMMYALALVLTYAERVSGMKKGYFFARAYVEKYIALIGKDNPEAIRAGLEQAYQARHAAITPWIVKLESLYQVPQTNWPYSWLTRFDASMESLWSNIAGLVEDGLRVTQGNEAAKDIYNQAGWEGDEPPITTPFMSAISKKSGLWDRLDSDRFFQTHMVCVNQLYKLLNTIGLTVSDKLAVLFFASRGVEDHFQVDPESYTQQIR